MTNPGQTFTVTAAAEACRVSRKTITRRLDQLRNGGAYKDSAGAWVIPLSALLHAGLTPGRPAPPDAVPVPQSADVGHQDTRTTTEVQAQLADLQRRAEVAEALAAERAEQITDLRRTLAMLTTGRPDTTPPPQTDTRQRGLLGRLVDGLGL
ncbi:hypothetical protein [Rhodococcus marinonascens]|uniref:hypothetical protein n=1 Tax=Rhodococcus marinonascens TaxID=38311 RepID=UPI000A8A7ABA|nr:hypothetical protein [Rhodococcus marinonascens]